MTDSKKRDTDKNDSSEPKPSFAEIKARLDAKRAGAKPVEGKHGKSQSPEAHSADLPVALQRRHTP